MRRMYASRLCILTGGHVQQWSLGLQRRPLEVQPKLVTFLDAHLPHRRYRHYTKGCGTRQEEVMTSFRPSGLCCLHHAIHFWSLNPQSMFVLLLGGVSCRVRVE